MLRDRENGQSIIIIAAVVVVLLALVALVVDVGNAYAHRRMVQNAVDAAALAGARRLADSFIDKGVLEIQVLDAVQDYAELNGLKREAVDAWFVDADDPEWEDPIGQFPFPVPSRADGVKVAGDLPFATYLAQLLGFSEMTASTTAKAWVLSCPCSAQNLFPITFSTSAFTATAGLPAFDQIYTLWEHDVKLGSGSWGFIRWVDDNGNNHCPDGCPQNGGTDVTLRPNILDNSQSGEWAVGQWVKSNTGAMVASLTEVMTPYVYGDPWPVITIPLYDDVRGQGHNMEYRVAGFAAFRLLCVFEKQNEKGVLEREPGACDTCRVRGSSDKCIRGMFEPAVQPGGDTGCLCTGIYIPSFRKP